MALNRRRLRTGRRPGTEQGPTSGSEPLLRQAPDVEEGRTEVVTRVPRRQSERDPLREAPPYSPWGRPQAVRVLVLANLAAASFYVTWWVTPGHAGTPVLFGLLAFAEAFNLLHLLGFWWATWATRFDPPPPVKSEFTIDVFIPTYGEPVDLLQETVQHAVEMDVPHKTFVLDDGGRDEVRKMAAELGAYYVRRTSNDGAKAGNLNNALSLTNGQLVVVFDADHVPRRDFLTRLVGYFEVPRIGFVQTPQFYGNARNNEVARGAFQQQAIFYGPICRGKEGLEAAFCCGTNVIFRRAAIADAGGFDEKSVVEDFVTSIRIHRKRWRSVYYPYVLAEGQGPSTLRSFFRQQFRWARGSVGALTSFEPFKRGLSATQRFQYLLATTFYLIGPVTIVYLLLPVLYLFLGINAFSVDSGSFILFYAPYLTLALVTIRFSLGGQLRLEHLRYTFGTFPVYALASVAAFLHIPARFRVTGGGETRKSPPPLVLVTVLVFLVTLVAIPVGALTKPINARTVTNMSWAGINLLLLWGIVRAASGELMTLSRPRSRRAAGRDASVSWATSTRLSGDTIEVQSPEDGHVLASSTRPPLPEWALYGRRPRREVRSRLASVAVRQVAALTAIGLVLRTALVDAQGLRLDESSTLRQALMPLGDMWIYQASSNVHVPLYHTIMNFWVDLMGAAEWVLRVPSIVFGTVAIPLVYLVGRRLADDRMGVIAAVFAAVSPFYVWHSDEARMYPLVLVLTLGSMLCLLKALDDRRFLWWLAYCLVTLAGLYTHYFFGLIFVPQALYVAMRADRAQVAIRWFVSAVFMVIGFVPWLVLLYLNRQGTPLEAGVIGTANLHTSLTPNVVFLAGYLGSTTIASLLSLWPLAVVGAATRTSLAWLRSREAVMLIVWLVIPLAVVFVVSLVWKPIFIMRYLIGASPPLFFLVAWAFSRLHPRAIGILVALSLVTFISLNVLQQVDYDNALREPVREALQLIEERRDPNDLVAVLPEYFDGPADYYLDDNTQLIEGGAEVRSQVALVESSSPHLWVIAGNLTKGEAKVDLDWLDERYPLIESHELSVSMEVRKYEIAPFD